MIKTRTRRILIILGKTNQHFAISIEGFCMKNIRQSTAFLERTNEKKKSEIGWYSKLKGIRCVHCWKAEKTKDNEKGVKLHNVYLTLDLMIPVDLKFQILLQMNECRLFVAELTDDVNSIQTNDYLKGIDGDVR